MNEEKIETLTDSSQNEPGSSKSEGSKLTSTAWLPVLTLLICLPLLSFLLTEYIIIPRIKHKISELLSSVSATTQTEKVNNTPAANEKISAGEIFSYEIKDIIGNLTGEQNTRYIRVSFVLESSQNDFVELMKRNEARIIDATLSVLSILTTEQLQATGAKNIVRSQLLQSFETALNQKCISGLYFSQFVVR